MKNIIFSRRNLYLKIVNFEHFGGFWTYDGFIVQGFISEVHLK